MRIEGVFRDLLSSDDGIMVDFGWRSNTIVADFGRFLASLMKKDFEEKVGIEYIAVGGGNGNEAKFREKVASFFASKDPNKPYEADGGWAWAKKIDVSDMAYLDDDQKVTEKVTNRLKIDVAIEKAEPVEKALVYEEFALLGIDRSKGAPNINKMFLVDYKNHADAPITKDASMKLSRTIVLTFPLGGGEVR